MLRATAWPVITEQIQTARSDEILVRLSSIVRSLHAMSTVIAADANHSSSRSMMSWHRSRSRPGHAPAQVDVHQAQSPLLTPFAQARKYIFDQVVPLRVHVIDVLDTKTLTVFQPTASVSDCIAIFEELVGPGSRDLELACARLHAHNRLGPTSSSARR